MQATGECWLPVLQGTGRACVEGARSGLMLNPRKGTESKALCADIIETMSTTVQFISARHFAATDLRLVPGVADAPVSTHKTAGRIVAEQPALDANAHCPDQFQQWSG